MAVFRAMPTGGANALAARLSQDAAMHHNRAREYQLATMSMPRRKWNRFVSMVANVKAREEAEKEAERQEDRAMWGNIGGAGGGAALSMLLAGPTGGASLAMMPSMMAGGSQIGRSVSGAGTPGDFTSGLQAFADPLTELFTENDPLLAKP